MLSSNNNPLLDSLNKALSGLSSTLSTYKGPITSGISGSLSNVSKSLTSYQGPTAPSVTAPRPTPQTPSVGATTLQTTPKPPTAVSPSALNLNSSFVPGVSAFHPGVTPLPPPTAPKPTALPNTGAPSSETPAQTYQRLTGQSWTGGTSAPVTSLLKEAGITAAPGSAQANLALQKYLIGRGAPSQTNIGSASETPGAPAIPAQAPKTPETPQPDNIDYATFLQNLLNSANKPLDYGSELTSMKSAYEGAFGTPTAQAAPITEAQHKLYEDAKAKALEDAKGDFANRGLFFSGDLDKALAGTGLNFANQEAAANATAVTPFVQGEQKSVLDLLSSVASSRDNERTRALSILPSLLTPNYGSGDIGNYNYYAQQEQAAGRTPVPFNDWLTQDAQRKSGTLSLNQQFQATQDLSKSLMKNTEASREISNKYAIMKEAFDRLKSGQASDLNATSQTIISSFNKIIDPSSVVRESEYARSPEGLSLMQRLEGMAAKLSQGGAGLTPEALAEFVALAQTFATNAQASLESEKQRIIANAKAFGLDPNLIVGGASTPYSTTPSTTTTPSGGGTWSW